MLARVLGNTSAASMPSACHDFTTGAAVDLQHQCARPGPPSHGSEWPIGLCVSTVYCLPSRTRHVSLVRLSSVDVQASAVIRSALAAKNESRVTPAKWLIA